MTLPERYTLTIKQGDTLKRWWRVRYKNGTVANLATAGYTTGRLTVRDTIGGTIQHDMTTANGGVVINYQADADGAFWSGYLYASATDTGALTPWGDGVYDFEISNGVDKMTVMEGPAVLNPGVTT